MSRIRVLAPLSLALAGLTLFGCGAFAPPAYPETSSIQALLAFEPAWPAANQLVQFRSCGIGGPTQWQWSFGDGTTSTTESPTHAYVAPGTYTVVLTISGAQGTSSASAAVLVSDGAFRLTSSAAADGGVLPAQYSCDGAGDSPDLAWSGAPAGTLEFALMATTIPVDGSTKWNWVLYGIPTTCTGIGRNGSAEVGTLGTGSHETTCQYDPPCPGGPGPKMYTLTLYALSGPPNLPSDPSQVTGDILTKAIQPLTLGAASFRVSYARP